MINYLVLSGIVRNALLRIVSPSGIPHCQFMLEHSSIQEEANFHRRTWCKIPVIISGYKSQVITQNIKIGSMVTVQGFISYHKAQNGLSKIVLHAKNLNLISFGD